MLVLKAVETMEKILDSLAVLCLKQVAQSVAEDHIHGSSLQDLPTHLLEDLAPVLSVHGLTRLHQILQAKGIDVQRCWLKFYQRVFERGTRARLHSCDDCEFSDEDWRQRFLDKTCQLRLQELDLRNVDEEGLQDFQSLKVLNILKNPISNQRDVVQERVSLDDFCPSTLRLESRFLPYIQRNEKTLTLLQKNLRELVLSHYLPKYNRLLRRVLEHLIHNGVLTKFTLKHPKCLTPAELFGVLEVCAGRRDGVKGSGDETETGKCHKRKRSDGPVSESKRCDSLGSRSEESTRLADEESRDDALPLYDRPDQEDLQPAERQQDLYDFCFSEPMDAKSDLDARYPCLSEDCLSEDCLGSPIPCTDCAVATNRVVDTPSSGKGLNSQDTKAASHQRHCPLTDGSDARIVPSYRQCSRAPNRCIRHLILCGFDLHRPDYSQVLQRVLSLWPGLRELEFIDNLMLKDSCHKILSAIIRAQSYCHSLRRLRIEDSSVQDYNLTLLKHLVFRSKLDTLELKTTDLCFSDDSQFQDGGDGIQHPLRPLEDAFSQLNVIRLSCNKLRSLACLERALLQPDCTVRHLDLESCQLSTEMLDTLFVTAKDSRCLRELNVGYNVYCPSLCEQRSGNGSQARLSGLAGLVRSSQLTKLNLTGCFFTLQGWAHGKDFVEALRLNNSLRQLLLGDNRLTNECLHHLVDAFITPSTDTDYQAPQLCLDISHNKRVTYEGLRAFRQALEKASTALGRKVTPPRHLTVTMDEGMRETEERTELAKITRLTVTRSYSCSEGRHLNYGDLMMEHLSQM